MTPDPPASIHGFTAGSVKVRAGGIAASVGACPLREWLRRVCEKQRPQWAWSTDGWTFMTGGGFHLPVSASAFGA